jgi:RNA polymerase sigma-70 factor (sigma-E family)
MDAPNASGSAADDPVEAFAVRPPPDEGFDALYRECWPRAVSSALRFTRDAGRAEELAQEAFTRAFDRWRQVSRHPAPAAWVLRVVINLAIDDARKQQRRPTADLPADLADAQTEGHDVSTVTSLAVTEALAALPAKQRQAVTLRYIGGFEEPEIAAAIGVRRGTVKTHLKRGVARLRELLEPDDALEANFGA